MDSPSSTEPNAGFPRAVIILVGLAAFVIAMAGVKAIGSTVAPTFLAATLVITAHPLQRWLVRHKCPGWLATIAMLVVLLAVIVALIGALAYAGAQLVTELPNYSDQFNKLYDSAENGLLKAGVQQSSIDDALSSVNYGQVFSFAQTALSQTLSAGSTFVFLLTVLIFAVMDAAGVPLRLDALAEVRPHLSKALHNFAHGVRTYWLVTTVFGAVVAVLDGIALRLLGVPLVLTWALLSFITNYIPNVGFVLGLVPPALLALLDGGAGKAIAVVIIYAVLNFVVQTIVQPRITGDAIGLSTMVAFLSLIFWSFVLGPLGALMALPVTLFVKAILIDADPSARWANAFISNKVTNDPEKVEEIEDEEAANAAANA